MTPHRLKLRVNEKPLLLSGIISAKKWIACCWKTPHVLSARQWLSAYKEIAQTEAWCRHARAHNISYWSQLLQKIQYAPFMSTSLMHAGELAWMSDMNKLFFVKYPIGICCHILFFLLPTPFFLFYFFCSRCILCNLTGESSTLFWAHDLG